MAQQNIFSDRCALAFELQSVGGRRLTWPQDAYGIVDRVGHGPWCQDDSIVVDRLYAPGDLVDHRRAIALDVALELYSRFGWTDPPKRN
jgi:hypothetical protein